MSDIQTVQGTIPYANPFDRRLTVMAEAEFDAEFPAVAASEDTTELDFLSAWQSAGQVPVAFPQDMDTTNLEPGPELYRIASEHKRSLDLPKAALVANVGDISVKGVTLWDPRLGRNTARTIFESELWGGMVRRDAVAAYAGSALMHARGLDFGEQILGLATLKAMPTKAGMRPTAEALETYRKHPLRIFARYPAGAPKLQPTAVVRRMPNSYRLWDIAGKTRDDQIPPHIIDQILNRSMQITRQQAPTFMEGLDPSSKADRLTYLTERLPVVVGYSYGRLVGAGLNQTYPHAGNMSLSLGLPDSDGVTEGGYPLLKYRSALNCSYAVMLTRQNLGLFWSSKQHRQINATYRKAFDVGRSEHHPNEL